MSNTSRSKWGSCCFPDTHSIIICASLALWKEHISDSSHEAESPRIHRWKQKSRSILPQGHTCSAAPRGFRPLSKNLCLLTTATDKKGLRLWLCIDLLPTASPHSRETLCTPHTEQENHQFTCLRVTAEGNPLLIFKETLSEIKFHWRSFHTRSGWKHRPTDAKKQQHKCAKVGLVRIFL